MNLRKLSSLMTQEEALEILKMGHNVFLTGPAGSGKTFLLSKYIEYLKKNDIEAAITASTGLAATHLNGRTLHSWCGMGIHESMNDDQIESLKEKEHLALRIKYARVLIIDEISMLDAKRLDLANVICQAFRQDQRPFGGLQVVLSGDFFQLPPVKKREDEDNRFVVESNIWNNMDIKVCYLNEQYRQEDSQYLKVLSDIRANKATKKTETILKTRFNKSIEKKIKPTKLYTHNRSVDAENFLELDRLKGKEMTYEMYSEGVPHLVWSLKESYCLAPEILRLKNKAVVMFVKNNFGKGYINGTLGKVVGFDEDDGYPVVETIAGNEIIAYPEQWVIEDDGKILASVSQVPLRLAWAITVHKSQGMSLDCAQIDLSQTFEYGMGYVALSRLRTLSGLKLSGINDLALKVNPKTTELDKNFLKLSRKSLKELRDLSNKEKKKTQKKFIKEGKTLNDILSVANKENIIDDIPF